MMNGLTKRLRGMYSLGKDGVIREDRDFGSYTPAICIEAANYIEQLQSRIEGLENILTTIRSRKGKSKVIPHSINQIKAEGIKEMLNSGLVDIPDADGWYCAKKTRKYIDRLRDKE